MQLCEAKYRPWDERRKKGCGCARRHVPEKRKASLADNRAKNAALSAFRRPFLRKIASRCSTGSVPRRVERSGRRRPPCRSDRGRKPCSQADWRKSRAAGEKQWSSAATPTQSGCTCPAGKLLFRILPVPARQKTGLWNCAVHVSSLFSISVLQPCFQSFIIKEDS